MSRDTVFQKIRPGVGFETDGFVTEKLGRLVPLNDSFVIFYFVAGPIEIRRYSKLVIK